MDGLWTVTSKSASQPRKSWISGYRGQDGAGYITSCPERQRTRTVRSVLAVTNQAQGACTKREGSGWGRVSPGVSIPGALMRSSGPRHLARCAPPAGRDHLVRSIVTGPDLVSLERGSPPKRRHRSGAWTGCGWTLRFRHRTSKVVDKALPESTAPHVLWSCPEGPRTTSDPVGACIDQSLAGCLHQVRWND